MFNTQKLLAHLGILLFSLMVTFSPVATAQETHQPIIIGKFKVIMASCDGESFLWKKQNQIISSGQALILRGQTAGAEESQENCQVEDRYERKRTSLNVLKGQIEEVYELEAVTRVTTCYPQKLVDAGVDTEVLKQNAIVKNGKISEPLKSVSLKKVGGKISLEMREFDLCEGQVSLELDHDRY